MKIAKITYSSHFARNFQKASRIVQEAALEKEKIFRKNCFDARLKTHKLKGNLQPLWSFSVTHTYRILFAFDKKNTVSFVDIGDHSIYQ